MEYEQQLARLIERLNYWTPETIKDEFYNGVSPLNSKYGNDWAQVWEDIDLGSLIIKKRYRRTFVEVCLYGQDGNIYRLNELYGDQDWNVWRDLYVVSDKTKEFRIEVPIYYSLVPINGKDWAFSVSSPPNGDLGINILEENLEVEDTEKFFNDLVSEIDVFARHLKTITEKYSVGTSPQIYCGSLRWLNRNGHYFMFPGNLSTTYDKAIIYGLAMMKIVHKGKWNALNEVFVKRPGITEEQWSNMIDNAKQRWSQ